MRKTTSENVLLKVSAYINLLESVPKKLNTAYKELKEQTDLFNTNADNLNKHYDEINNKINTNSYDETNKKSNTNILAGILAGAAAIAAFAPTAIAGAIGAFGTASTGAAISSLSGAAATNATLAYIGGGSLAAGGGGIVAGKALLANIPIIGWSIAAICGRCCISGAIKKALNHTMAKQQAIDAIKELHQEISYHKSLKSEFYKVNLDTKSYSNKILQLLFNNLAATVPGDYSTFNHNKKDHLLALINNINSFSKLLNKQSEIEK